MDRSFIFWMFIGVLMVILIVGIFVILLAFSMRAGSRAARVILTVMGAGSFVTPIVVVAGVVVSGGVAWPGLLLLIPCGLIITATVLMWHPDASAYFRAA